MHIFSTSKLVDKFNNNQLSPNESVKYLIVLMVLISIVQYTMSFGPSAELSSDEKFHLLAESLFVVLFTIFGVSLCYRKSEQVAPGGFVERFICLALPALVQSFMLVLTILLTITIVVAVTTDEAFYFLESHLFWLAFVIISEIIFYRIIYKAIGKLSIKPLLSA